MTGPNARLSRENFARSRQAAVHAGLSRFDHVAETGSTNADLMARATTGPVEAAVLVADHQTAGRGRLDRRWEDLPGNQLLVSFLFPVHDSRPQDRSVAVAAAARAGLEALGQAVAVKWPNDLVIVDGPAPGKLAGLLAEFVNRPSPAVVVGLGLNVGPVPVEGATSLAEVGLSTTRDAVLAALLAQLSERLADPGLVHQELITHSATLGQRVRVELPNRQIVGRAVAIDRDGRLEVDEDGERHHIGVGDVIHLRRDSDPQAG